MQIKYSLNLHKHEDLQVRQIGSVIRDLIPPHINHYCVSILKYILQKKKKKKNQAVSIPKNKKMV